jgi:hypothetical protein
MLCTLHSLWENNRIRIESFGTAPDYRGRELVISLWWSDDHCWFFHLLLRRA